MATPFVILHLGLGSFHRAHQAVYLHHLIEQVGAPLELYDRPANQFVAQFIGTPQMNVLPAAALPELTRIAGARLPADGSVGVRPEYVRIAPVGRGIAGKVELVESLGSDTLIHTRVGANVPLVSRQSDRTTLKLGDAVGVEIDPTALLFFDSQGRALREMQQAA